MIYIYSSPFAQIPKQAQQAKIVDINAYVSSMYKIQVGAGKDNLCKENSYIFSEFI